MLVEISEKSLVIAAEAAGSKLHHYERMSDDNRLGASIEAHARTLDAFEAFKREVSDAVEEWHDRWIGNGEPHSYFMSLFARFILPKPVDPLVEVFRALPLHGEAGCDKLTDAEWVLVAEAARRGLTIKEEG